MENGSKLRPNQLANVRIRDMEADEALVMPEPLGDGERRRQELCVCIGG